jgi:hypothetical protein
MHSAKTHTHQNKNRVGAGVGRVVALEVGHDRELHGVQEVLRAEPAFHPVEVNEARKPVEGQRRDVLPAVKKLGHFGGLAFRSPPTATAAPALVLPHFVSKAELPRVDHDPLDNAPVLVPLVLIPLRGFPPHHLERVPAALELRVAQGGF